MGFLKWLTGLRHRFFPKRWGVVDPGMVFRSGRLHPDLVEKTLLAHGIKVIVNLCGDPNYHKERPERDAAERHGIKVFYFSLGGRGQGEASVYVEAITRIVEATRAGKPVHVHCAGGTHRTGGVVAVYRVLVQGWTPARAMREMARYGWNAKRHNDLRMFLDQNMAYFADELFALGVIEKIPTPLPRFYDA